LLKGMAAPDQQTLCRGAERFGRVVGTVGGDGFLWLRELH
jgi:hypothetical protein